MVDYWNVHIVEHENLELQDSPKNKEHVLKQTITWYSYGTSTNNSVDILLQL